MSPGIDQSVLDEPRETFTATLSLPSTIAGLSVDSAKTTATVTIVDKDPTLVTLSAPTGSISENGGTKTLTLKLGRPLVSPEVLTVPLNFGGVANRNSEYTVSCASAGGVQCNNLNSGNASVTFTGGANASATATLTITGIEDNVEEGSESVTVSLGTLDANSGTNLDGGASGSGSVNFNLSETPTIAFERDNYEVTEGDTVDVVVVLSQELEGWVIGAFDYEYETASRDDTRWDSEVFYWFEPGDTRLSVSVPTVQDDRREGDETFRLEMRYAKEYVSRSQNRLLTRLHGTKADGPPPATTTITILDDEEAPAGVTVAPANLSVTEGGQPQDYTLVLNRAPTANVTVIATTPDERRAQVHSGQEAPARRTTLTFTPGNWDEPQPVTVTAVQDSDIDDHTVRINHEVRGTGEYASVTAEPAVVVITDDDTEVRPLISIYSDSGTAITEGVTARFRVTARPAPSGSIDVSVTVAESGDFADGGQTGPRTVTIGSRGWSTFHIGTDNDSDDEANGAITATVDPGNGYDPDPVADSASITVRDNDEALRPEASFAASSSSAGEGAGTRNIRVDFDPALATGITLRYDVSGNATGGGNDYSISNAGSLQVSAGASSASIPVSIVDDSRDEANETVRLSLTSGSGSGYQLGARTIHTLTITDNDDPPPATPVVSISGGGAITEGGTATFNLSATPAPQSQITVNVNVVDSGSFTGSGQAGSRQVTIGAGGSGTLTVTTDNDTTDEPDGSLTATIASGQGYSPSSSSGSASIAVNDNDLPPPTPAVSISGGGGITEGGTASFTLTASPAPQGSISVNVNVTQSGNFARGGQTGTRRITIGGSGTATFSVTTTNDSTDEPNGRISAAVRSGTGYTVHSQSGSYSVTVNDDDEPLPQISISRDAASVGEGQAASFTLSANPTPSADLVVHLDISQRGDFAAAGATGAKTVTFPANTATASHTVATVDDDMDERDGSVTARVVSRSHYRVASANEASVSVTDDDVPVPEIRVTSEQASRPAHQDDPEFEGATLKFTLHADVAPEADLDVTVQVAEPGNAFVNAADSGTRQVTIRARQKQATLSVRTVDDGVEENPSTATVTATVQSGTGYTVAPAPRNEAESDIHDNDGLPTLSISDGSAEEGDEVYFVVTLSKPAAHDVRFQYGTESGDYNGRDYGSADTSVDFAYTAWPGSIHAGGTRFEIWVETFDDAHNEGNETFTVILSHPSGATIEDGEGTGTIKNSDPLPDAWLARFGRAVAEQSLDGITTRIEAVRNPGRSSGFQGNIAGKPIGGGGRRQHPDDCQAPGQPAGSTGTASRPPTGQASTESEAAAKAQDAAQATQGIADFDNTNRLASPVAGGDSGFAAEPSRGGVKPDNQDCLPEGLASMADNAAFGTAMARSPAGIMQGTGSYSMSNGLNSNPQLGQQTVAAGGFGQAGMSAPGGSFGHTGASPGAAAASYGAGISAAAPGQMPQIPGSAGPGIGAHSALGSTPEMMLRQLLSGSHFSYTREQDEKGGVLGFWGRGAVSSFNGGDDALRINGDIGSAMLGADYIRGDWLFGLALTETFGDGGYSSQRSGAGTLDSSLTAAIPYAAWNFSERLSLWGAAGHGAGLMRLNPGASREIGGAFNPGINPAFNRAAAPGAEMPIAATPVATVPERESLQADIGWSMASLGLRSEVFALAGGGPRLALVSDALWTRTTSGRTGGMMSGAADVSRLRLGVESSWTLNLGLGSIQPKLEAGLRHDGGDAETGFGLELGGGLAWQMPELGLSLDVQGRTLLLHEAEGRDDIGFSASLSWDPGPESKLGPKFSLRQDFGGHPSGGLQSLFSDNPINDRMGMGMSMAPESRWTAEAGWSVASFAKRFLISPTVGYGFSGIGRDYSLGWALEPLSDKAPDLSIGLRLNRRESGIMPPEHALGIELRASW